jgi:hypothetical protein
MKDSPFDKFPAGFSPLLAKLPEPDEAGNTALEGHWWRKDRDSIAIAIGKLGRELQNIQRDLDKAREAEDIDAVRKGIGAALIEIQEVLMPIYGADLVWPISQAIQVFDYACARKRNRLTALTTDDLSTRRDDPVRHVRQALAAAALDFFAGKFPNRTQGQIAEEIAAAMGKGGFLGPGEGGPPSARTTQHWRTEKLRDGDATRPAAKYIVDSLLEQLEANKGSTPIEDYFDRVLADITKHCRDAVLAR